MKSTASNVASPADDKTPQPPAGGDRTAAQLRETHSGIVVLVGDRAYKAKKPVDLGFLDFRDIASRRLACERELTLNRRLAPDVYLGIGQFAAPESAEPEPVLVMRRMPEKNRLATLVRANTDVSAALRQVARLIAAFHAHAARGPDISAAGSAASLWQRWRANLTEAEPYCPDVFDSATHAAIRRLALRYIDGRIQLFTARAAAGLIVDGHGDLIADDIFCLPDGPRVLDCLDFDDRLRWVDVLDDIAFLAMDLEHLNRPDLSAAFVAGYQRFAACQIVPSLLHHYIAYRAFVRAKVAAIRARQNVASSVDEARDYADLASRHLRAGEVKLVLVGGGPASGKTTLARAVADRLDYTVISTDTVRRELDDELPRYSDAAKDATYRELLRRARQCLDHGQSVILDATWDTGARRRAAAGLAAETVSTLVALECEVSVEVAAARAEQRRRVGQDASEAGPDIVRQLTANREHWTEAHRLCTSKPLETYVDAALDAVHATTAT